MEKGIQGTPESPASDNMTPVNGNELGSSIFKPLSPQLSHLGGSGESSNLVASLSSSGSDIFRLRSAPPLSSTRPRPIQDAFPEDSKRFEDDDESDEETNEPIVRLKSAPAVEIDFRSQSSNESRSVSFTQYGTPGTSARTAPTGSLANLSQSHREADVFRGGTASRSQSVRRSGAVLMSSRHESFNHQFSRNNNSVNIPEPLDLRKFDDSDKEDDETSHALSRTAKEAGRQDRLRARNTDVRAELYQSATSISGSSTTPTSTRRSGRLSLQLNGESIERKSNKFIGKLKQMVKSLKVESGK
uniref:Uncharacterized protein n=1 Tax=Timspurckia oligopyrenoides TaxID=708627 RepID=A0A7S0ZBI7_9RHOD|mmetsp:Transcript_11336/g.20498  ORF Transcript_11336/g.20498 Transcript_11336/m.20498 type:complete len:302 (+) Transcript_11336:134-1039(+)